MADKIDRLLADLQATTDLLANTTGQAWDWAANTPSQASQEWRKNRATHDWATLDGENYACAWCDTKTGREPCPR